MAEETVKRAAADDPAWVNRPGGPLKLPPLVAVTHSSLLQIPEFQARLHRCARLLLQAGADPDQHIGSRWPPESLDAPDDSNPLSALYGAAGCNHDLGSPSSDINDGKGWLGRTIVKMGEFFKG